MRAAIFVAATLFTLPALAQQSDPVQSMVAEWQAKKLADEHTEAALSRLIGSYEARLSTAMEWLKAAQAANAGKPQ